MSGAESLRSPTTEPLDLLCYEDMSGVECKACSICGMECPGHTTACLHYGADACLHKSAEDFNLLDYVGNDELLGFSDFETLLGLLDMDMSTVEPSIDFQPEVKELKYVPPVSNDATLESMPLELVEPVTPPCTTFETDGALLGLLEVKELKYFQSLPYDAIRTSQVLSTSPAEPLPLELADPYIPVTPLRPTIEPDEALFDDMGIDLNDVMDFSW